ncbi:hypothetical protein [Saccharopolyspora sp. 5N708]
MVPLAHALLAVVDADLNFARRAADCSWARLRAGVRDLVERVLR